MQMTKSLKFKTKIGVFNLGIFRISRFEINIY